jgi:LmbE family N-acetylglucosaminyl deacetylase
MAFFQKNKFQIPYHADRKILQGKTLVFAPHADDEIFGCGGALIRHIQQNDPVKVVVVTDGSYPVTEEQKSPDYPEIRRQESIAAAKLIGYNNPVFLNFPDNSLKLNKNLINSIKKEIEDFKPINIYFPNDLEIHPDHRVVNKAVLQAIKKIKNRTVQNLISYEVSAPLYPNYLHDITDVIETLESAMDCFKSQLRANDYSKKLMALKTYRTYTLPQEVLYAEAYNIISIGNRYPLFKEKI